MKRFILSAFSVMLAVGAVAPTAQALPKLDSAFTLQTLRLNEFDARNKSEDYEQPYGYPQSSTQPTPQNVATEQEPTPSAEPTVWQAPTAEEEVASADASLASSLTELRHESLDRN